MEEVEVKVVPVEEKNNARFQFRPGLPSVTNILILGSIGVGKSTFINGLINYLSFGNIHEALQNRFHVFIKSAFTHTTENMQTMRIEMEPTVRVERCGPDHEEDTREGHSATQSPKSYLFKLGPPGQEKHIRIIDTPGVGDVRGAIQVCLVRAIVGGELDPSKGKRMNKVVRSEMK